jgi:hypothetical protein
LHVLEIMQAPVEMDDVPVAAVDLEPAVDGGHACCGATAVFGLAIFRHGPENDHFIG